MNLLRYKFYVLRGEDGGGGGDGGDSSSGSDGSDAHFNNQGNANAYSGATQATGGGWYSGGAAPSQGQTATGSDGGQVRYDSKYGWVDQNGDPTSAPVAPAPVAPAPVAAPTGPIGSEAGAAPNAPDVKQQEAAMRADPTFMQQLSKYAPLASLVVGGPVGALISTLASLYNAAQSDSPVSTFLGGLAMGKFGAAAAGALGSAIGPQAAQALSTLSKASTISGTFGGPTIGGALKDAVAQHSTGAAANSTPAPSGSHGNQAAAAPAANPNAAADARLKALMGVKGVTPQQVMAQYAKEGYKVRPDQKSILQATYAPKPAPIAMAAASKPAAPVVKPAAPVVKPAAPAPIPMKVAPAPTPTPLPMAQTAVQYGGGST